MKKVVLSIFLLLFWVSSLEAASELLKSWVYTVDNSTITFAWNATEGTAGGYEFKTVSLYPPQEWIKKVATTQTTITRPRAGLFKFAVRGCESSASCTGEWAYSDGPNAVITNVDGTTVVQSWIVFWRFSPVIIH